MPFLEPRGDVQSEGDDVTVSLGGQVCDYSGAVLDLGGNDIANGWRALGLDRLERRVDEGSVRRLGQAEIVVDNILHLIKGESPKAEFDGHANCFIESGFGKGILIDFNYDTEPLPGTFPLPGMGPFDLLKTTKMNHYGKMLFRWIYWHILLKGKEMPIENEMTMAGKKL